jgi:uncharacterized protein YndB with AHSA1/START domain
VPTARVRATVAATPRETWKLVSDPHQLPRWWPRAVRVEGVSGRGFTVVLTSARGRDVRADQRVVAEDRLRRRVWAQVIDGTPFASTFVSSETELRLEPAQDGAATVLTLAVRQRLRGGARLGAPLVWRSTRRQLRDALAAARAQLEQADAEAGPGAT